MIAEQSSADGCLFFCRYVKEKGSIFMNHSEPIRNARSLGLPKMLILGLQHMFAMFGATVLVPILVQSYGLPLSIQTTLLFARNWHVVFSCLYEAEGSCFFGLLFRLFGWLPGSGQPEFRDLRQYDRGGEAAVRPGRYCGGWPLSVVLRAVIKLVGDEGSPSCP